MVAASEDCQDLVPDKGQGKKEASRRVFGVRGTKRDRAEKQEDKK